ncbi:hypothetical protein A9404_08005 [Halothiobacillus diazotrophicus]|uniref:DNA-3-methyladenine glycosylase II n=1 Tax=Halothiobacillus diazotrophicus TaxID=1860122 RepID=A0A191ZHG2_9GAMM|nr:AlkA N-terminal domain-containing protein [Halothiobacillus diazotrophicus]ANJ67331.1 hypothetical protein A9404_08005 [Halothiobacillus diazotrophicus]
MTSRLDCSLTLPADFRPSDILSFHRRDPQEIAERVTDTCLYKGMIWGGYPAQLTIEFAEGVAHAALTVDGPHAGNLPLFQALVHRLLGLNQDISAFEAAYREHPQLGQMIARNPGLRVPVTTTPFEALTWAITGQQISVQAAVSLRRKLIVTAGIAHSSSLLCYPEAPQITALPLDRIRQAGYSRTKAETLHRLAGLVADGSLPLDAGLGTGRPLSSEAAEALRAQLLAVKGIGPWTVSYALLRGFGWLDGSLHGDVAVRRGLQRLIDNETPVDEKQARDWLIPFAPWRALVAAHLWAWQSSTAY